MSLQSCDGSEYNLQGPAGADDITGLPAEPTHYQLLSELGESATIFCQESTWMKWTSCTNSQISCEADSQCHRTGVQQPEPGEHGAPYPYRAAGSCQTDEPGWVHRRGAAAAHGGLQAILPGQLTVLQYLAIYKCLDDICVSNLRMRFCWPDCSATPICWHLAWFSAPAASCGSSHHSWPMVSHVHTLFIFISY